ncbi:DUF4880 domain-containing protein, partial [Pseudomonas aeruginosa]|nr:DUF4880 domain-containing protein [Pseudomonas aeruginosa]
MNSPQEQQQIRQQAAEWAIRLDGGDLDRSRREALDGWLADLLLFLGAVHVRLSLVVI